MRLQFIIYFTFFLIPFNNLIAQSNKPLKADTLRISIGEDGKLKSIPGFALIDGKSYYLKIEVEKPEIQHAKFIKNLRSRLTETYDKLDDDTYPFKTLYSNLWTETFDSIKQQIKDLQEILANKNPMESLEKSSNSFSFFLGKAFLKESLFGNVYAVHTNLSKEIFSAPNNQNLEIEIPNYRATGDTMEIDLFTPDLEKQFLYKYFEESRKQIATNLDTIKVHRFYKQINDLKSYRQPFSEITSKIEALNGDIICDKSLYNAYKSLITNFNNHELLRLLRTGWISTWVQYWIWKLDGYISLNPLGFTDEKFLPIKENYDSTKAKEYDAYRTSIVDLMIKSKDLDETKVNISAFDMALKQKGTGSEQFSYASYNNSLIEKNKNKSEELQLIYPKRITVKLPVIKIDNVSRTLYRFYDANDKLKGSNRDDTETISNKVKMAGVAYNLLPKEEFKINEKPVEVPNESQAIRSIKEVGEAISGVLSTATPLTGILTNMLSSFLEPKYIMPALSFGLESVIISSAGRGVSLETFYLNQSGNFILKSLYVNNQYILRLHNRGRIVEQWNFTALINQSLRKENLLDCEILKNKIKYELLNIYIEKEFLNDSVGRSNLDDQVINIKERVFIIVKEALNSLEKNRILNDITLHSSIIDLITSTVFYTLPPTAIEPKKGKSPAYRNEFVAFADEKKAFEKNSDIVVINTESKNEKKRKDYYVTAPETRVTPSIGIAYIFNSFRRSEVKVENGVVSNNPDEEQVRLITGFHIHLAPLIMKDDRNIFKLKNKELLSRFSVFAGVSFPKPFYNLHPGISADIWPGVKVTYGAHFYRFTNYSVLNNQVIDQDAGYVYNKNFASINIDPLTFVKFIGIFK